ncbi:hypothetical protein F4818DRAFT_443848 [Hypoxylon cercidicola]|nr:hypothetical protein F4818DRAFT_443848 [Hypoxylon cercidicola]
MDLQDIVMDLQDIVMNLQDIVMDLLAQPRPAIRLFIVYPQTLLTFDGTPWDNRDANAQTWMYAREARQQQADTIAGTRKHSYPSYYRNSEELPLSTPGTISPYNGRREWLHQPLVPGRETAWAPRTGTPKGAVRSFYTRGTPTEFDVGFHDPKAGKTPGGSDNFSLARYHAAVPPPPRSPTI